MLEDFGISNEALEKVVLVEKKLIPEFNELEENANYNSLKVLSAFKKYNLSEIHLGGTTGYGFRMQ